MDTKHKIKILIVEDDSYYNIILTKYIKDICSHRNFPKHDFEIHSFRSAKDCIQNLSPDTDIVFLDYFLNESDEFTYTGFDILKRIKAECRNCKVVVVSSQRSVTVTTELFKKGIYDYIDKDYLPAKRLSTAIQRILNGDDSRLAA